MRHVAEVIGLHSGRNARTSSRTTRCSNTKPVGRYVLQVCRTLSCALVGAERLSVALSEKLGVKVGETDATGTFTLLEVEWPRGV